MVFAGAVLLVITLLMGLWSLMRTILRSPDYITTFLRNRRGVRGYLAISQGLVAVGSGDVRKARKFANEAERIAPGEPLALLLAAQSAQLSGNRGDAERAFRAMAARGDTKLLGLRGLFVEAQRRGDLAAARAYAEEAANTAPSLAWAGQAVLEFRCAAGDWAGALATLETPYARAASSTSRPHPPPPRRAADRARTRHRGDATATAPRRWPSRR